MICKCGAELNEGEYNEILLMLGLGTRDIERYGPIGNSVPRRYRHPTLVGGLQINLTTLDATGAHDVVASCTLCRPLTIRSLAPYVKWGMPGRSYPDRLYSRYFRPQGRRQADEGTGCRCNRCSGRR